MEFMINKDITLEMLNNYGKGNMVDHLGIEYLDINQEFIAAKMPVDHRTRQTSGILHGGASVALAETLGSVAGNFCVDQTKYFCVGLDINANHIRGVQSGYVYGKAWPVHLGRKTQVWQININNEQEKLVCTSRLTLAVVEKEN